MSGERLGEPEKWVGNVDLSSDFQLLSAGREVGFGQQLTHLPEMSSLVRRDTGQPDTGCEAEPAGGGGRDFGCAKIEPIRVPDQALDIVLQLQEACLFIVRRLRSVGFEGRRRLEPLFDRRFEGLEKFAPKETKPKGPIGGELLGPELVDRTANSRKLEFAGNIEVDQALADRPAARVGRPGKLGIGEIGHEQLKIRSDQVDLGGVIGQVGVFWGGYCFHKCRSQSIGGWMWFRLFCNQTRQK